MARVLVVDDEKLIVKGIRFSLEQDGYEVDCAYDGDEAIERAKSGSTMWYFWTSCFRDTMDLRSARRSGNFPRCRSSC